MHGGHFTEYRAEVGRQRQVTALVQLLLLEAGPTAKDLLAAVNAATDHEERCRVTMVRAARAIL